MQGGTGRVRDVHERGNQQLSHRFGIARLVVRPKHRGEIRKGGIIFVILVFTFRSTGTAFEAPCSALVYQVRPLRGVQSSLNSCRVG